MSNIRYYICTAIVVALIIAAGIFYMTGGFSSGRTITTSGDSFVIDKSGGSAARTVVKANQTEQALPEETTEPTEPVEPQFIQVHITGAVKNPGVYEVSSGSRVNDVLKAAGGEADDADLNLINLAAYVRDAEKLYIPRIGDETQPSSYAAAAGGLININTASLEELTTLPGIGPVTAEAIVRYRVEKGAFKKTEDIKNVARIGEKTYEALKDLITVNN